MSAEAERIFSGSKHTICDQRARLGDAGVRERVPRELAAGAGVPVLTGDYGLGVCEPERFNLGRGGGCRKDPTFGRLDVSVRAYRYSSIRIGVTRHDHNNVLPKNSPSSKLPLTRSLVRWWSSKTSCA